MRHQVLGDTLAEKTGCEVLQGKGGFWVRGRGFVTLAQARKMTGIVAPKRPCRAKTLPYGEYAWFAAMNGRLNG